jgi:hypothetical protein
LALAAIPDIRLRVVENPIDARNRAPKKTRLSCTGLKMKTEKSRYPDRVISQHNNVLYRILATIICCGLAIVYK